VPIERDGRRHFEEKGCSISLRTLFQGSRGPFPFDDLHQDHSDLKQNVERSSHQSHIEDIRGGRDDRSRDGNEQNSIPSFLSQKGGIDDLEVTQESKDQRKFEGESEAEDKNRTEGDIFRYGDHRLDMGGLIPQEELNPERQSNKIAEEGSEIEKEDGRQKDRGCRPKPLDTKHGGERLPEMVEDQRNGNEEACINGKLNKGEKRFRDAEGDQINLEGGIPEMAQQRFGERENGDSR